MTIVNPLNNSIQKMLRYTPPGQSVTSIAAKRCSDNGWRFGRWHYRSVDHGQTRWLGALGWNQGCYRVCR
jgi:hypothetical protein